MASGSSGQARIDIEEEKDVEGNEGSEGRDHGAKAVGGAAITLQQGRDGERGDEDGHQNELLHCSSPRDNRELHGDSGFGVGADAIGVLLESCHADVHGLRPADGDGKSRISTADNTLRFDPLVGRVLQSASK
jgi:hypothetical protein